ncbi:unnamed protein product, partial [Prorocentrum cordatum]
EALAGDADIYAAVVFCASPPDESAARAVFAGKVEESTDAERSVAISVLIGMLTSPAARPVLARDPRVRHALVAASESELREVAAKANAALALLAMSDPAVCVHAWGADAAGHPEDEGPQEDREAASESGGDAEADLDEPLFGSSESELCAALLRAAAEGVTHRHRAAALGSLWSLACTSRTDPRALWASAALRDAVLSGAAASEPYELRESALGLLWGLAAAEGNRLSMWCDAGVRRALREGVAAQRPLLGGGGGGLSPSASRQGLGPGGGAQPPISRSKSPARGGAPGHIALAAEVAVSFERASLAEMPPLMPEPPQQPLEVRAKALWALASLAEAEDNRGPMWQDKKLAKQLLEAACIREDLAKRLRLSGKPPDSLAFKTTVYRAAMRVLLLLAQHEGNREEMRSALVPDILAAAAEDAVLPAIERRAFAKGREVLLVEGQPAA